MIKATTGHEAYHEWLDTLITWSEREHKGLSMTEEQAEDLRALLLLML